MPLAPNTFYCHACKVPQPYMRCGLCGRECDRQEDMPALLSEPPPKPAAPSTRSVTLLDLQIAMSQWLYGRMMDENPTFSLLHIARTSGKLWGWFTDPDAAGPHTAWERALLHDARMLWGHHFSKPIAAC